MTNKNYVALHNHSDYSTLDGYATIDEYIKAALEHKMIGIGLSDHGTASGLYKFITRAQKAGLIPVPGIEFYLAPENPEGAKVQGPIYYGKGGQKAPKYDISNGAYTHLTVFAYNNIGISNLFKLTSMSWEPQHFYFKPRIDTNMLAEHSEGLIVTTGCPSSEINRRFLLGQDEKAYEYASRLKSIFGDNFYVELMDHKMHDDEIERIIGPKLIELSKKLDIPPIITNDSHYAFKQDSEPHERILAVSTRSTMNEPPQSKGGTRFAFSTPEYYIKTYDEMRKTFPGDLGEIALANTVKLTEKCKDIKLEYDPHLRPEIDIPEGHTPPTYLQKLIYEGFKKKRGHQPKEIQTESVKRIQEEFQVIHSNDFISYFLVVHDYIDYAHKKGIGVGAGRGCFVPGTKVKANQGTMRNIEDVKVGDKVQTHDTTYQKVENLFIYDVEDENMTRLTLSNGKIIESTSDHMIFHEQEGFMEAKDFSVGDVVLGPKGRREPYKTTCDSCGDSIKIDKQTYDIKSKKGHYKPEGEYWCYDCVKENIHKIPAVKEGSIKGALRNKDKDIKEKMSKSLKKHWEASHDERIQRWHEYMETPEYDEYRESRRQFNLKKYSDPVELEKLTKQGKSGYKSGYFTSHRQNKKEIYYASSYEQKALNILETSSQVTAFDRYKGKVPYIKPSTGLEHNYLPDFIVEMTDGTKKVIEVKAKWQLSEVETKSKLEQAEKYFNEKKIQFEVWDEDVLEELNDDWHNEFEIVKVEHYKYTGKVYDIQVENVHNYNVEGVTVHNSVGGSEIAYLLDISNTDPIRFDLLFERFLSPGRGSLYQIEYISGEIEEAAVSDKRRVYSGDSDNKVVYVHELDPGDVIGYGNEKKVIKDVFVKKPGSAPDIDTDFHTEGREEVVQYCVDKYGAENVANIVTFGTFKAKRAFKAMCTIYNVPFAAANKASGHIPGAQGAEASLQDIMDPTSPRYNEGEDFRNATEGSMFDEVIEMATKLDGRISETGVHPCGVIISSQPLAGIIPTQVRQNDGKVITQWEYPELEALGLIKMDLLGLELINTIQQTLENIELTNKSAKIESEIREVPDMKKIIQGGMDDPATYKVLQEGNTVGIFQLGSPGVRDLLKRAKPKEFMDIATITALYRPGPMSMNSHTEWADRKNGTKEVISIDKELKGTVVEDILSDTAGVLVYQESLMQIATRYAMMTPYESDLLRKAMGKKNMDIMLSLKPKFIEGAINNGSTRKLADKVWETMVGFAAYGFNKCFFGRTLVSTGNGKKRVEDLYKLQEETGEDIYIESMFEDGTIKPHKVKRIVKSGRKPVYKVKTKSGRFIYITKEHRMLTTSGYGCIEDGKIALGNELIIDGEWNKRLSKEHIKTKKKTMSNLNKQDFMREQSRKWMKEYQSTLTFGNRSAHQKEISKVSNRHEICLPIARAKLAELRKDPEWVENSGSYLRNRTAESGYHGAGRFIILSDGRAAHSLGEAMAAEYLIERGIEFDMHKELIAIDGKKRYCDFYINGLYFEMDGMRRGRDFFVNQKYGTEIPFVYMTPEDFGDVIDEAIMNHHIENGDEIVEIIPPKIGKNGKEYTHMTYDIEMDTSGPANFIANGLVSHNSHSVSYAINIYEAMYLKTHYPSEFMAAVIQQGFGDPDKVKIYIQEAKRMKLRLGAVDINNSQVQMASTGVNPNNEYDIVFGFSGVKQLNDTFAGEIVKERNENGLFKSVADFAKRMGKRTQLTAGPLSNLALAGAFDSLGASRKLVAEKAKMIIDSSVTQANKGASLFSMLGPNSSMNDVTEAIEVSGEDFDYTELIKLEANTIGMYVSGHPTSRLGHIARMYKPTSLQSVLSNGNSKDTFTILGTVTQMKSKTNKSGGRSIAVLIDDGNDTTASYLPKNIVQSIEKGEELDRLTKAKAKGEALKETKRSEKMRELIDDDNIKAMAPIELNNPYVFKVKTKGWGDSVGISIVDIISLDTAPDGSLPYEVNVKNEKMVNEIKSLIDKHKDVKGVYVKLNLADGAPIILKDRIKLSLDFIIDMEKIVGKENIVTEDI